MDQPLVSCLCVTEDRPAFAEWVLWNFGKQDYANRELVVVDSSRTGSTFHESDCVRVVSAPPGTSVPAKRNLALSAASGEILTWFDDDDWQHPRKLSLLDMMVFATLKRYAFEEHWMPALLHEEGAPVLDAARRRWNDYMKWS